MALTFRVGLTGDFYDPEGRLIYRDIGLDVLEGMSVQRLDEHRPEIGPDQLAGLQGVIVLTPRVTARSVSAADDLLAVGRFGVGYDSVDVAACTRADVALFIAAGAVDRSVAEATVAWMLALLLGLAPVGFGVAVLAWVMVFGFSQRRDVPERVPLDWSPAILMTGGPYAVSRHPMYVGELALWLGWTILYGSIPVLIGFAVLGAVVARLAPREERALEAKFGDVYRQYKARVPRWLGVARRDRVPGEPGAAPDRRGT